MSTTTAEDDDRNSRLEEAMNTLSYVRIGNRIRYFGENGNAFCLSDEPPLMCALSMPNLSRVLNNNNDRKNSHGNVLVNTDTEDEEEEEETESMTSESSISSIVESNAAISAQPSPSISATSSSASTPTGRRSLSSSPSPSPRSPNNALHTTTHFPSIPTPFELGLPLKLPRPPAAHLPPPLPKRPPSGSTTNTISDTCSLPSTSRPHSPSSAMWDGHGRPPNTNEFKTQRSMSLSAAGESSSSAVRKHPIVSSPTFFRNSGTLTVSVSYDKSTRTGSMSSPGSPITTPTTQSSSVFNYSKTNQSQSNSDSKNSALIQLKNPSSFIMATAGLVSSTSMESSTNSNSNNNSTHASTGRRRQLPRQEGQVQEQYMGAGPVDACVNEQDRHRPSTPDSGIDCQLDSRSHEKQLSLEVTENKRSFLPPEISSICKGSVSVADLVTGALVTYMKKSKDTGKNDATKPKPENSPTTNKGPPENEQDTVPPTTTSSASGASSSRFEKKKTQNQTRTEDDDGERHRPPDNGKSTVTTGGEKKLDDSNVIKQTHVENHPRLNSVQKQQPDNDVRKSYFNKTKEKDLISDNHLTPNNAAASSTEKKDFRGKELPKGEGTAKNVDTKEDRSVKKKIRDSRAAKKKAQVRPRFQKGPNCGQCGRAFGLRTSRHHCRRCWKSFCEKCLPVQRYNPSDPGDETSVMSRICSGCSTEHAIENCRGHTRGLWSEFEQMRKEARDMKGLDVTSKVTKTDQHQTVHDLTTLLRKVCVTFLVELQQHLERSRTKTSATMRLWETTTGKHHKAHKVKIKEANKMCLACHRHLRYLTESRDCAVCGLHFCTFCTARTLQLYLPRGTNLNLDIGVEMIRFYIKTEDNDEILDTEASETYYTCLECEDSADRFLNMLEFNQKIPELETEMFDLQRHIEHALSYTPMPIGRQRCMSTSNLTSLNNTGQDMALQDSNIKLAHRLYERYLRLYGALEKIKPATGIQITLHKHIKQAMYGFYLSRREQLQDILRRKGSLLKVAEFTR